MQNQEVEAEEAEGEDNAKFFWRRQYSCQRSYKVYPKEEKEEEVIWPTHLES